MDRGDSIGAWPWAAGKIPRRGTSIAPERQSSVERALRHGLSVADTRSGLRCRKAPTPGQAAVQHRALRQDGSIQPWNRAPPTRFLNSEACCANRTPRFFFGERFSGARPAGCCCGSARATRTAHPRRSPRASPARRRACRLRPPEAPCACAAGSGRHRTARARRIQVT